MRTRRWVATATVVLMSSLTGCDAGEGPGEPTDRRPGVAANAVPGELQGTWRLDVYCVAVGAHLEKGGFGEIVERPSTSEGRNAGRTIMTLALYPEYFEISWLRSDQTWQVGWSGPAHVEKGILYLDHRHLEGIRDSFTWSLDKHRLSLHYPATSVAHLGGTANRADPVAYFSLPWTAVDCPPRQG
jgi:hypothetical protein